MILQQDLATVILLLMLSSKSVMHPTGDPKDSQYFAVTNVDITISEAEGAL